jgi:hypothetical protein
MVERLEQRAGEIERMAARKPTFSTQVSFSKASASSTTCGAWFAIANIAPAADIGLAHSLKVGGSILPLAQ